MGSRLVFVKPGRGYISNIGVNLALFPLKGTRFQTKENTSDILNKPSDMARLALLTIVTLALVALSNGMAAPEPAPQPILNMLKGMMGGMQKHMGGMQRSMEKHMSGKNFQMPDFGKMMSGMMEKKQQLMGRKMGMMQKMMGQITSKFSKFGGGGKKGGKMMGWN